MVEPMTPEEFETRVLSFEQAWQGASSPVICEFLSTYLLPDDRLRLLHELVCIDLECRWRQSETNKSAALFSVDDYLRKFPELGKSPDQFLELVGEEYRVRHCWGDQPSHADFLAGTGDLRDEVAQIIRQVDRDLEAERENDSSLKTISIDNKTSLPGETLDPRAPLPYGDYVLRRLIGSGRMGKVYQAWQRSLDRPVAVKYLRKSFLNDRKAIDRFLEEARTVARIRHPGIIGVHGLGRTPGGGYFLVMDWIDGRDLAAILERERPSISQAVRWTIQACEAIEETHQHGIVHCDLKPGNLLLAAKERVCVTDFGLARSLTDDTRTEEGIEGTAPFMAPEQVSQYWGPISPQTDVYGLGAVLYTLWTGQPPWTGRTLADVLAGVVSATPAPSPESLRPQLPASLVETCRRCLSKSPGSRFPEVAELRQALEDDLAAWSGDE